MEKEHILKLKRGDIALIVNSDDGWYKKMSIAFADDYEEINPKAGQLLFLDGHTKHGVPINTSKVSGRTIIAGLFTYIPKNLKK